MIKPGTLCWFKAADNFYYMYLGSFEYKKDNRLYEHRFLSPGGERKDYLSSYDIKSWEQWEWIRIVETEE